MDDKINRSGNFAKNIIPGSKIEPEYNKQIFDTGG